MAESRQVTSSSPRNPFTNRSAAAQSDRTAGRSFGFDEAFSSSSIRSLDTPSSLVGIEGSNAFTEVHGNYIAISAPLPVQSAPPADALGRPVEPTPDARESTQDIGPYVHLSDNAEHPSEVYARLLYPKREGYPLWSPQPGSHLPEKYRKQGIGIGDVGLITPDGEFDFLFNICVRADDEINPPSMPEGFVPIDLPDAELALFQDVEEPSLLWEPRTLFVNGAVRCAEPSSQSPGSTFIFECRAAEGAALVLPEGASRKDARRLNDFFLYAGYHARSWYKFAVVDMGRSATNGSIYLITGCDKAPAWGTSAYLGVQGTGTFGLKFSPSDSRTGRSRYRYAWDLSSLATTKQGPQESAPGALNHLHNQSVFLRGFKVKLGESLWDNLFGVVDIQPIATGQNSWLLDKAKHVPLQAFSTGLSRVMDFFSGAGGHPSSKHGGGNEVLVKPIVSNDRFHPADTLNSLLLKMAPRAELAIAHDNQWCSLLLEEELEFPDSSELFRRVKDNFDIVDINGVVSFTSKGYTGIEPSSVEPLAPEVNPQKDPTRHTDEYPKGSPQLAEERGRTNPSPISKAPPRRSRRSSRSMRRSLHAWHSSTVSFQALTQDSGSSLEVVNHDEQQEASPEASAEARSSSCSEEAAGRRILRSLVAAYEVEGDIGRGAYGFVKKARERYADGSLGPPLAIKFVIKSRIFKDAWIEHPAHGLIPTEVYTMSTLSNIDYALPAKRPWDPSRYQKGLDVDHDESWTKGKMMKGHSNICSLLDYFEDGSYFYLVLPLITPSEMIDGPTAPHDLFDLVEQYPEGLPPRLIRTYLGQIADGIAFMHANGIVHRDIKDENIALGPGGRCSIIDFGSAAFINKEGWDVFSGTLDYAAPEILRGERYYGKQQDVWAFGVVGYVLLVGECPFATAQEAQKGLGPEITNAAVALQQRCGGHRERDGEEADGGGALGDAADLVKACLRLAVDERPTFEEILNHPFLAGTSGPSLA